MVAIGRFRLVLSVLAGLCTVAPLGCATQHQVTLTAPTASAEPEPAAKPIHTGPVLLHVLVWRNTMPESMGMMADEPDHYLFAAGDLKGLLAGVYGVPEADIKGLEGEHDARLGFEIIGKHDASRRDALMSEAAHAALGYSVTVTHSPGDVIELTRAGEPGPPLSAASPPAFSGSAQGLKADGYSMPSLCNIFQERLNLPVIDRTGLRGTYAATIALPAGTTWDSPDAPDVIAEQLHLHAQRVTKDRKHILVEWP